MRGVREIFKSLRAAFVYERRRYSGQLLSSLHNVSFYLDMMGMIQAIYHARHFLNEFS